MAPVTSVSSKLRNLRRLEDSAKVTRPQAGRGIFGDAMPEYVIEREIPGAGRLTEDEVREDSLRSLEILKGLGPRDPVDPQLRHRQPDLLRLPGP